MKPLAFSKELLPVGSRREGDLERPKAVSEYLLDRMVLGGARKICMVIGPGNRTSSNTTGGAILGRAGVRRATPSRRAVRCPVSSAPVAQ